MNNTARYIKERSVNKGEHENSDHWNELKNAIISLAKYKETDLTHLMYMGEDGSEAWDAFANSNLYYVYNRDVENLKRREAVDVVSQICNRFNIKSFLELGPGHAAPEKTFHIVSAANIERYDLIEMSEEAVGNSLSVPIDSATEVEPHLILGDFYDNASFSQALSDQQDSVFIGCWGSTITNLGSYGFENKNPSSFMTKRIESITRNVRHFTDKPVFLGVTYDSGTPDLMEAFKAYNGEEWKRFTDVPFVDFYKVLGIDKELKVSHTFLIDMNLRILHTMKTIVNDYSLHLPISQHSDRFEKNALIFHRGQQINAFPLWKPEHRTVHDAVSKAGATVVHHSKHKSMVFDVYQLS